LLAGIMPIRAQKIVSSDTFPLKFRKPPIYAACKEVKYLLFLSKDELGIACYDANFHFKQFVSHNIENLLNSSSIVGAVETGQNLTLLFRDNKHFSTLIYHPESRVFELGKNFEMGEFLYLSYFAHDNKLKVLGVKKNSSLLSIVAFDSIGTISKMEFELTKDHTLNSFNTPLSMVLYEKDPWSSSAENKLKKIDPEKYCTDLEARGDRKLFINGDELLITLNLVDASNQIIKLNLSTGAHKIYTLPFPVPQSDNAQTSRVNSFVTRNKAVCVFDNEEGFNIGIYDLDSAKYIKKWLSSGTTYNSFKNYGLVAEDMRTGYIDTFKSWSKFYKKHLLESELSIAGNTTTDDRLDLYVGATKIEKKGAVPIGGAPMMMGGGTMLIGIVAQKVISPYEYVGDLDVDSHFYLSGTIDSETLETTNPSKESVLYMKFKAGYIETMQNHSCDNIIPINLGNKFYIGYYMYDSHQYVITEYK
jgi:hypothetical protein